MAHQGLKWHTKVQNGKPNENDEKAHQTTIRPAKLRIATSNNNNFTPYGELVCRIRRLFYLWHAKTRNCTPAKTRNCTQIYENGTPKYKKARQYAKWHVKIRNSTPKNETARQLKKWYVTHQTTI